MNFPSLRPSRSAVAVSGVLAALLSACSGSALQDDGPSSPSSQLGVSSTASPATASWAPWPQAQHDAHHSGASTDSGPTLGQVLWRRSLASAPTPAGPVVGRGGVAYLTDSGGTLHAIDLSDGRDRWTARPGAAVGGDLSIAPLILPDGDIVTGYGEGLVAWAASDGHEVWRVPLGSGGWTSPVTVDGSRIWVAGQSGVVAAIDVRAHRGERAWVLATNISSYGSVVTNGDGRVYTTSFTGLVAIDDAARSARVAWTRDPDDDMVEVSAGLSTSGIVVLGTNGRREWAYNRAGDQIWQAPRGNTYSSPSVTDDGLVYVAEKAKRIHVFDVNTGQEVGRYSTAVTPTPMAAEVWTSVVVDAKHNLYFATRSHYLAGLRADGSRLFSIDLGTSTASYPALAGGHLLIATDAGELWYIG